MKKQIKNEKVHTLNKKIPLLATMGALAFGGVILFQGSIPKAESRVTIKAISPSQGAVGTDVVITGSGFSTSVRGITGTKVNNIVYAPGNFVLIQGDVVDGPILSSNGQTLTARVSLATENLRMYCAEKFLNSLPCKVQAKVVNAYGKESGGQYFIITSDGNIVPTTSCVLMVSPAQTTPVAQNISPGQSGVTLVKFNATPNCDGTLESFAVSLLPMPNGYQNISSLRLYDDVSGVQLGTTQNVTVAGMNFASINTPLTANQAMVLRVVGDVSAAAINGSTVYGVFGGSYGVTGSGGMIGNNASGNIIAGNTMTIAATQYTAPGTNPRIMYWWGKVNQHTDENGNWLTDPDGVSGADLDKLIYCKKFYQNTIGVEDYILETTDTWRDRGNVGGPYTSTKISTKCLQPS
ncbi:MAG: hypothetical protein NUV42_02895 [Candidatus Yonathbacteria bacterium]|nr:hypothetical protein [Candidatus Uhrbacteria bacterium]MCR4306895.1 hypothetical protein [Candidatus Yonathbacteria bacterium]